MICKVCQKEIPDGARFCPECGSRTQNINCINCGAEITPEVKFCPGCGRPISSPSNNSTYSGSYNSYQSSPVQPNLYSDPGYTPKKKKPPIYKRLWFWLLIIAVVGIVFLSGGSGDAQQGMKPSTSSVYENIPEPENPYSEKETTISLSGLTFGEKNALESAYNYLELFAFSHKSLINQLEFDGYTSTEAAFAADNCGADWTKQAEKAADNYLDFSAFSYDGLIRQLEFDGFTEEEATYAVEHCGADWKEQAKLSAKNYLSFTSFSKTGLIEQLEFDGFTHEQAVYGAEQNGY